MLVRCILQLLTSARNRIARREAMMRSVAGKVDVEEILNGIHLKTVCAQASELPNHKLDSTSGKEGGVQIHHQF